MLRIGLALAAVALITACPKTSDNTDGPPGEDDGAITEPPLRDVQFTGLSQPDYMGGTVDGVMLSISPYNNNQTVLIANQLGEGEDLILECGAVSIQPPELHVSLNIVFNDDNATLLVYVLDQNGQMLTSAPIDTHADASSVGITRVDAVYKRLQAAINGGNQRIGAIVIASCLGFVHEIVLQ